jgi:hypothetical protein
LRQEICQGAFVTEDVPPWTGDWFSGVFEAETAVSKGQEGISIELSGACGPIRFGLLSFV